MPENFLCCTHITKECVKFVDQHLQYQTFKILYHILLYSKYRHTFLNSRNYLCIITLILGYSHTDSLTVMIC